MKRSASVLVSLAAVVTCSIAWGTAVPVTASTASGSPSLTEPADRTLAAEPDAPLNDHTLRPKTGLFFNNPTPGGHGNVRRLLVDRFDQTPGSASVRLMTWNVTADDNPIVAAIERAYRRGVSIRILTGKANCEVVKDAFSFFVRADSWVHCVDGGGETGQGMHMKVVTFSATGKNADGGFDTVPHVTLVGSANLTTGASTHQWNDMFQYANRSDIYGWYTDRFDLINLHRDDPKVVQYDWDSDSDGRARANFMPIDDASPAKEQDPVWDRLDNLPVNPGGHNTVIRVAMFASDLDRGQWLINKLVSMRAGNADIRFIAGPDVKDPLLDDLRRAGIPYVKGWRGDCTPETNPDCEFVHLKMMTAQFWENDMWNYRSYTGSENWNWDGLTRNFEVTQRIGGEGVHENYNILFDRIWNTYS